MYTCDCYIRYSWQTVKIKTVQKAFLLFALFLALTIISTNHNDDFYSTQPSNHDQPEGHKYAEPVPDLDDFDILHGYCSIGINLVTIGLLEYWCYRIYSYILFFFFCSHGPQPRITINSLSKKILKFPTLGTEINRSENLTLVIGYVFKVTTNWQMFSVSLIPTKPWGKAPVAVGHSFLLNTIINGQKSIRENIGSSILNPAKTCYRSTQEVCGGA